MPTYHTIAWINDELELIDQRQLPLQTVYNRYTTPEETADAIRTMVVRGAPAIGVTAAYGMALALASTRSASLDEALRALQEAAPILRAARPTAVNLFWAVDRILRAAESSDAASGEDLYQQVLAEAHAMFEEDVETNRRMGLNALEVVPDEATFIHHCNTGALATVDYGTALGVIRIAHEHGKKVQVLVDETRPRLQGGRLTAWELQKLGIPFRVIADGASGYYMRTEKVDLCVVGADRIAANGDVANKIGTYNLAIAAKYHNVPFYCVAPLSTFDMSLASGDLIPIEQREAREVTHVGDCQITPDNVEAGNPAFDITPAELLTGIITEKGILYPPFRDSILKAFKL
jgi:methylthioribose-1-phosphate isomerase